MNVMGLMNKAETSAMAKWLLVVMGGMPRCSDSLRIRRYFNAARIHKFEIDSTEMGLASNFR
jgi:hypothetical protein